jgi:hypothetical protein
MHAKPTRDKQENTAAMKLIAIIPKRYISKPLTHIIGRPAAPTLAAYHSRALAMAFLSVRPPQN